MKKLFRNSCRNCQFHYKDGHYHAHCKIGLQPEPVLWEKRKCTGWQEKIFYDPAIMNDRSGQLRLSVR